MARYRDGFHNENRPAAGSAEPPKIPFPDLRHSAATLLGLAEIADEAIQKLLGHPSVRTTHDIYTYLTAGAQKDAAEKWTRFSGQ